LSLPDHLLPTSNISGYNTYAEVSSSAITTNIHNYYTIEASNVCGDKPEKMARI
jgi:hypothetical protein